jgi:hypothetical protein
MAEGLCLDGRLTVVVYHGFVSWYLVWSIALGWISDGELVGITPISVALVHLLLCRLNDS